MHPVDTKSVLEVGPVDAGIIPFLTLNFHRFGCLFSHSDEQHAGGAARPPTSKLWQLTDSSGAGSVSR